jgi:SAM-dependent methyltransferase
MRMGAFIISSTVDVIYDTIGRGYAHTRREEPRIAQAIVRALGDARSVVNVGAGAGSYEPRDREVLAVEPSDVMIAQRPRGSARVVRGRAEELPLPDDCCDAAMAILSDHHWEDRPAGLREMRRVARRRVVIFNADPAEADRLWVTREYLPEFEGLIPGRFRSAGEWQEELGELLPGRQSVERVPIPHDCRDGFYGAWWRHPEAYLDPRVRAGISFFAQLPRPAVNAAIARLRADLESGAWQRRHADLLELEELDLGYKVLTIELD